MKNSGVISHVKKPDLDVILTPLSSGRQQDRHRLALAFNMTSPLIISQTPLPPNDVEIDVINRSFFDRDDRPNKQMHFRNKSDKYKLYTPQCDETNAHLVCRSSITKKLAKTHVPVCLPFDVNLIDTPSSLMYEDQNDSLYSLRPATKKRRKSRKKSEKTVEIKKRCKKRVVKCKKVAGVRNGNKRVNKVAVDVSNVSDKVVKQLSDSCKTKSSQISRKISAPAKEYSRQSNEKKNNTRYFI